MTLLEPLCGSYKPFPADPSICATCGHEGNEHARTAHPDAPDFVRALTWTVIRHGAPYSYYGGGPDTGYETRNQLIRDHYSDRVCGIDWQETGEPQMSDHAYFAGTFADGDHTVNLLTARVVCKCHGEGNRWRDLAEFGVEQTVYFGLRWVIRDISLSQLIWYVTHVDDEKEVRMDG